ncbi:Uncharacterised protein [Mycobacterium tuberculosis]|nr:Uncharacterised protein [Mycobacterium tuberculosis]
MISGSSDEITTTPTPWLASSRRMWWISDLAPTSTPRVGSSISSTDGLVASSLAMATFC